MNTNENRIQQSGHRSIHCHHSTLYILVMIHAHVYDGRVSYYSSQHHAQRIQRSIGSSSTRDLPTTSVQRSSGLFQEDSQITNHTNGHKRRDEHGLLLWIPSQRPIESTHIHKQHLMEISPNEWIAIPRWSDGGRYTQISPTQQ